ncbi:putative pectin methylesterase CGR2 [Bienertia sinuspersici]
MSRRPVNPARRLVDNGNISLGGSSHSKSRSSPLLSIGLVLLVLLISILWPLDRSFGGILFIAYSYSNSGRTRGVDVVSKSEGSVSCTLELQQALPMLKKAYGDSMRKVLHVGPDTCSVVSKLLKEENTEAWGVEPYDVDDVDNHCQKLVRKGMFELLISSYPGHQRPKVAELAKFGRPAKLRSSSWWIRYFVQTSLEENESATKKFEQAAAKRSYRPTCQVFHLKAYP